MPQEKMLAKAIFSVPLETKPSLEFGIDLVFDRGDHFEEIQMCFTIGLLKSSCLARNQGRHFPPIVGRVNWWE